MGGAGGATNPEQLFAAGYAACFHSALKVVAGREELDVTGTEVSASVGIGMLDNGGFGLEVELDVHAPALDQATAEALVAKAHEVCPYSNATRGNVEVTARRVVVTPQLARTRPDARHDVSRSARSPSSTLGR